MIAKGFSETVKTNDEVQKRHCATLLQYVYLFTKDDDSTASSLVTKRNSSTMAERKDAPSTSRLVTIVQLTTAINPSFTTALSVSNTEHANPKKTYTDGIIVPWSMSSFVVGSDCLSAFCFPLFWYLYSSVMLDHHTALVEGSSATNNRGAPRTTDPLGPRRSTIVSPQQESRNVSARSLRDWTGAIADTQPKRDSKRSISHLCGSIRRRKGCFFPCQQC